MSSVSRCIPHRYLIAMCFFFGFINVYITRVNFSIAIVAMTANVSTTHADGTVTYAKDFDWNSKEQGWVLGGFFYGYVCTQFIGGFVSRIIGAGRLCGMAIFVCGLLTFLTPLLSSYGTIPLIITRGLLGVAQVPYSYQSLHYKRYRSLWLNISWKGVVFPAALDFWSHWAPPMESSRLISLSISGCNIGTFLSMSLSGMVAEYLNWRWIFYFSGKINNYCYI